MRDVFRISVPITLWLVSFSAIYGLHGLVCAFGLDPVLLPVAAIGMVLLQAVPVVLLSSERFGASTTFLRWTSLALAIASLVAMVWTVAPVAFIAACV